MTYEEYIEELSSLLPQLLVSPFNATDPFVDATYNSVLPQMIRNAELMIYRDPELNLQNQTEIDTSGSFVSGNRQFTIPGNILIVESLAAIVANTRISYYPATVEFITNIWPNSTLTTTPSVAGPGPYFAMLDDVTAIVAPTPDSNYSVEVKGVIIPATLAQTPTATTYLTLQYPDLFLCASMIYWSGMMKSYGQQADDPRLALSWKTMYDLVKGGSSMFEARKRAQAFAGTPEPPPITKQS